MNARKNRESKSRGKKEEEEREKGVKARAEREGKLMDLHRDKELIRMTRCWN
jgi:hypothetical protein